jgi:dihydroorotase
MSETRTSAGPDLLLVGGRVIDPASGTDASRDVAVTGGRIAAVGPSLPREGARRVVDVSGSLVTPGLIDLHAHVYRHVTDFGVEADDAGINAGCTTIVDQGSAGAWTFDGFKAFVVDRAATEVLLFISTNLTGTLRGCRGGPVCQTPELSDVEVLARFAARFPEVIRGVKGHSDSGGWSHWGNRMFEMSRECADATGLPLYVHTGELWKVDETNRPDPRSVMRDTLALVRPGDLLAHCYSCRDDGILGPLPTPPQDLLESLATGVHLDLGHGVNFSFDTARRMMDAGLVPYTISSDVHGDFYTHDNDTTLDYSLLGAMSKLLAMGFDLDYVIRAVTVHPATVLRMLPEIGTLAVGSRADLSVLDAIEGPWTWRDCLGTAIPGTRRLVPRLVVRAGQAHVPTRRLLRDVTRPGERLAA